MCAEPVWKASHLPDPSRPIFENGKQGLLRHVTKIRELVDDQRAAGRPLERTCNHFTVGLAAEQLFLVIGFGNRGRDQRRQRLRGTPAEPVHVPRKSAAPGTRLSTDKNRTIMAGILFDALAQALH